MLGNNIKKGLTTFYGVMNSGKYLKEIWYKSIYKGMGNNISNTIEEKKFVEDAKERYLQDYESKIDESKHDKSLDSFKKDNAYAYGIYDGDEFIETYMDRSHSPLINKGWIPPKQGFIDHYSTFYSQINNVDNDSNLKNQYIHLILIVVINNNNE